MTKVLAPMASYAELEMLAGNGAEELYCGVVPGEWLDRYTGAVWLNRRSPAGASFTTLAELKNAVRDAHGLGIPVFVTLNAPSYTARQTRYVVELARRLEGEIGVDALVVADPGLMVSLREAGVATPLHVSSVASVLNAEAVRFFADLGAARIVLPRSLSLPEVTTVIKRSPPGVGFEVFVFNDGCVFDEGFCYTTHHHWVGAMCLSLVGCAYEFVEINGGGGGGSRRREPGRLSAHLHDYHDWVWTLSGRGGGFSPTGYPLGPCGLCALPDLAAAGVAAVKIAGREASPFRKLASVKIVRKVLDRVRAGAARKDVVQAARKLKGTPDLCTSGYACYYRELRHRAEDRKRHEGEGSAPGSLLKNSACGPACCAGRRLKKRPQMQGDSAQ